MVEETLKIKMIEGEYWWGGAVQDGYKMPYDYNTDIKRDLMNEYTSNQIMPLFISNKGRYIWSDDGLSYIIKEGSIQLKSRGQIEFAAGYNNLKDVYEVVKDAHFPSDGQIPYERLFTRPQYNTWIELMYDQEEDAILKYAEKIIEEGYPTGVLMIDDNWQEDYGVWEFSGTRFNNPKKMVEKIHDMGMEVMLWVCPFISPDCLTYRQLRDQGLLIVDKDGEVAIRKWWNGYSAVLDLTNPESAKWFDNRLQYLMKEYGIDGFKFDAGDPDYYREDDQTYKQLPAIEHAKVFNEFGLKYRLNEFRSAYNVAGLALAQRLSDKHHSWDKNGLNTLIPNALAQGLMGYAYTCPDMIGGGEYLNFMDNSLQLDEELVVRYAQCSALFPMMQFSASPWRVLSKDNAELCRQAAILHDTYGEYILGLARDSSKNGAPIIRHMAYAYPNAGYEQLTSQFMLGSKLLVAPVIEKGVTTKEIDFPEGTWKGDDDSIIEGPTVLTVDAPIERLPYFKLQ